jgi:ATP-binding cassette, subfamily B, bacterial
MIKEVSSQGKGKITQVLRLLRELLSDIAGPERKRLLAALILICVSTFGSLAGPFLIKEIIDVALPAKDVRLLGIYSVLLILTNAIALIFWSAHSNFAIKSSEKIFLRFREKLVSAVLRKRLDFFSRYGSGDILTRVNNDMDLVSLFLHQTVLRCLAFSVFSIVLLAGLMIWNWRLGLTFLLTLPFLQVYAWKTYEPATKTFRLTKEKMSAQSETLLDILAGVPELRFYQQAQAAIRRFRLDAEAYTEQNVRTLMLSDYFSNGLDFLGVLVRLLPFIVGGLLICMGSSDITIGMLVAYFVIFFRLALQIFAIFQGVLASAQALPSLQRLKEFLDFPEDAEPDQFGIDEVPDATDIEFRDVSFSYPGSHEVFTGLNLRVNEGEKVAIMGQSGSGKSTLAQLITRFLVPNAGHVLFGGKDVRSYPLAFYLSFFAYVRQEAHLFKVSFRDNIAMGWYGVPMDRIREAASLVRMNEVIERLPMQYETVYAENGTNLSGGQKQRIALARALIRDPHILVLDEFTSGLDPQVEKEILDDMFTLFEKQTIICITHKQSVADRFQRTIDIGQFYRPTSS